MVVRVIGFLVSSSGLSPASAFVITDKVNQRIRCVCVCVCPSHIFFNFYLRIYFYLKGREILKRERKYSTKAKP